MKQEILLEAGTNELEIVEFLLAGEYYGINVAKVREIIRGNCPIVPVPDAPPSVIGVVNLRGRITPVVDLAKHLNIDAARGDRGNRIIIAEFNRLTVGFWVTGVTRIHRLSWKQVESPSGVMQTKNAYAVGIVKIEDRILFLLDFEKVASMINPNSGIQVTGATNVSGDIRALRGMKKILVVEDSSFISDLLKNYLLEAGYQAQVFINGQEAWDALEKIAADPNFRKIEDHFHLMITDLEMPQMDGLHLIKKVREKNQLKYLPCVVFSSLISPEQALKCQSVGADGQISKPEIENLVKLVDSKVL
jgi:two-component system chemotaxis response regulator CheV